MEHVVPYCGRNDILIEAYCPLARMRYEKDAVLQELVKKVISEI
jgi:diketogulonate reductase-like aldo/keto reductase